MNPSIEHLRLMQGAAVNRGERELFVQAERYAAFGAEVEAILREWMNTEEMAIEFAFSTIRCAAKDHGLALDKPE